LGRIKKLLQTEGLIGWLELNLNSPYKEKNHEYSKNGIQRPCGLIKILNNLNFANIKKRMFA